MRKIIIGAIIIAIAIGVYTGVSMFMEKNKWVCDNGEWVKYGNPMAPKPSETCNKDEKKEELPEDKSDLIRVDYPKANNAIASPLEIKGEARGTWFFEADFPIKLYDSKNNLLATGIAQAQGEWMTAEFVPFEAEISFDNPQEGEGVLVLIKDNPSDMPEHDDELRIPIIFGEQKDLTVKAYFNNSKMDPEYSCYKVFSVNREIPHTKATARAAVEELLKGPTAAEKADGFFTSINENVKINSLVIENKTAKIDFNEQIEYQLGGSCRVSAIRAQITETLKQFSTIDSVVISVNGRAEDVLQP